MNFNVLETIYTTSCLYFIYACFDINIIFTLQNENPQNMFSEIITWPKK